MADLERFRARVETWVSERYPVRDPGLDDDRVDIISRTPDGHDALVSQARGLQRDLHDAGFASVQLPVDYGGQGLTRGHAAVVDEVLARYDTPSLRPLLIGISLAGATLLAAGTEAQKRRYLPPVIRGDEMWCQLFSEPDAGSDLVSLRTRAVRDRDRWLVDGQKVWSSYAADADYGMLLARTDPEAERPHAGITMFIVDMADPGVVVAPLVDIAGGQHFNEVFLEAVSLDDDDALGKINEGWRVSSGTLGGERSSYMGGSGDGRRARQVTTEARAAGRIDDPSSRQRIVDVIARERILEWLRDRLEAGQLAAGHPAAGSLMKVAAGNLEQRSAELAAELAGPASMAWPADARDGDAIAHQVASSRQATIAGGTHQIQRNLIGERVLGLPR